MEYKITYRFDTAILAQNLEHQYVLDSPITLKNDYMEIEMRPSGKKTHPITGNAKFYVKDLDQIEEQAEKHFQFIKDTLLLSGSIIKNEIIYDIDCFDSNLSKITNGHLTSPKMKKLSDYDIGQIKTKFNRPKSEKFSEQLKHVKRPTENMRVNFLSAMTIFNDVYTKIYDKKFDKFNLQIVHQIMQEFYIEHETNIEKEILVLYDKYKDLFINISKLTIDDHDKYLTDTHNKIKKNIISDSSRVDNEYKKRVVGFMLNFAHELWRAMLRESYDVHTRGITNNLPCPNELGKFIQGLTIILVNKHLMPNRKTIDAISPYTKIPLSHNS